MDYESVITIFERVAKDEMTAQEGAELLLQRQKYFKLHSWTDFALGAWFHVERVALHQWWMRVGDHAIWCKFRWPFLPAVAFEKDAYKYSEAEVEQEARELFHEQFKRLRKIAELSENVGNVTRH